MLGPFLSPWRPKRTKHRTEILQSGHAGSFVRYALVQETRAARSWKLAALPGALQVRILVAAVAVRGEALSPGIPWTNRT